MTKRGNDEGSIYKRADGRWAAQVTVEGGVRRYLYAKTRAEAARKLTDALNARQEGLPVASGNTTLAGFLAQWMQDSVQPTVRESTFVGYEVQVRRHIVPHLGRITLAKLSPQHLQTYYRERLASGLSPRTVQLQHRILHMAMSAAVKWSLVPRNVVDLVDAPRVARKPVRAFSVEQARQFLTQIADDRLAALYVLTLATGLRRGEALALSWDDFDVTRGTIAVRNTLTKVAGGWQLTEPKTEGSRRGIKLPAFAIEALRVHRVRQLEERLGLGEVWRDTGLIFVTVVGTHIDGTNLLRAFHRHLTRAGLPAMRFHSLRHSAATLMLALGVQPKVVAEMLGHSRVGITLDVYSHVLPHLQDEAASRMDGLLGVAQGR